MAFFHFFSGHQAAPPATVDMSRIAVADNLDAFDLDTLQDVLMGHDDPSTPSSNLVDVERIAVDPKAKQESQELGDMVEALMASEPAAPAANA